MKLTSLVLKISESNILLQHKEFEEIEGRLQKREPLILGATTSQRLSRRLPVEVISDPLDDVEIDPYEDGSDAHKLRGHQVSSCDELRCFSFFFFFQKAKAAFAVLHTICNC